MLKIHFRSVGIGDNIILEFPNGRVGIVDCNHCWRECLDFLEGQLHAEELEFVVGTHPDFDHIRGLQNILYITKDGSINFGILALHTVLLATGCLSIISMSIRRFAIFCSVLVPFLNKAM